MLGIDLDFLRLVSRIDHDPQSEIIMLDLVQICMFELPDDFGIVLIYLIDISNFMRFRLLDLYANCSWIIMM